MSNTQLQTTSPELPIPSILPAPGEWQMILQMGQILVKSGMLPSAIKSPEAAAAIILKGRELAIPPMQAFSHIHIIQGRPTCSAELQLALLARGGVTWAWLEDGINDRAVIEFQRRGFAAVRGSFSRADADAAKLTGKDTWKQYQANMLRARAISNGARMIGPDLLAGMSYTPEEMGAEVDEDGQPLEGYQPVAQVTEVVDTETGEITNGLANPAEKKERAPYWAFLDRCAAIKTELHDPDEEEPDGVYYGVINEFGFAHASEVDKDDTKIMRHIINTLRMAQKEGAKLAPEPAMPSENAPTGAVNTTPAVQTASGPVSGPSGVSKGEEQAAVMDRETLIAGIEHFETQLDLKPRPRQEMHLKHGVTPKLEMTTDLEALRRLYAALCDQLGTGLAL